MSADKKITSFSFEVDNNLQQVFYLGRRYLVSPYRTKRLEILYDDGSEDIEEIQEGGYTYRELKDA